MAEAWMLRELVRRYVVGELDLARFQRAFEPLMQRLISPAQSYASRLASFVDLLMSEVNLGHRSEKEFKTLLAEELDVSPTFDLRVGTTVASDSAGDAVTRREFVRAFHASTQDGTFETAARTQVVTLATDREVSESASDIQHAMAPA